jgi:hypothetical protein
MNDFCQKITNDSIRKLTEKYNLERNKPKINHPLEEDGEKPTFHLYHFLLFLSISTIAISFCKRLK